MSGDEKLGEATWGATGHVLAGSENTFRDDHLLVLEIYNAKIVGRYLCCRLARQAGLWLPPPVLGRSVRL